MKPTTMPTGYWQYDVVTPWRHKMIWKPGEVHQIKKEMSRRERRIVRHRLHSGHEF